jgi:hypothetical protein
MGEFIMAWKAANRWQAFGIHLAISITIFILLAAIIYFWWYPGFLFLYDGGLDGMKLIAGVDIFIGPVLTLCVYKLGKKSLVFDLSCIAVLQIICLCGGMFVVHKTRPIAIVYAAGSYATTNMHGYEDAKQNIDKIKILKQRWPASLAVDLPEDSEGSVTAIWGLMGDSVQYNVDNYVPYEQKIKTLAKSGLQVDSVKGSAPEMHVYQSQHPELRFFPMTTSVYEGYVAVDLKTGKIMKFFKTE